MDIHKFIAQYQAELNKAVPLFTLTMPKGKVIPEEIRRYIDECNLRIKKTFRVSEASLLVMVELKISSLPEKVALGLLIIYSELFTEDGLANAWKHQLMGEANADFYFPDKLHALLQWAMTDEDGNAGITEKQMVEGKLLTDILRRIYSARAIQRNMKAIMSKIQEA